MGTHNTNRHQVSGDGNSPACPRCRQLLDVAGRGRTLKVPGSGVGGGHTNQAILTEGPLVPVRTGVRLICLCRIYPAASLKLLVERLGLELNGRVVDAEPLME